jgi:hypothetical protein
MTIGPAPEVRSIVDQDGAVILDLRYETMLILNATGGYIWERLRQGQLVDEIIADLARDTGADRSVVEPDVAAFMEELKTRRLLPEFQPRRSGDSNRDIPL